MPTFTVKSPNSSEPHLGQDDTKSSGRFTVQDLLFQADFVGDRTFNPDILLIAGAIYIAMTLPLGALVGVVERRWAILR